MNEQIINAIAQFMQRVTLQGSEVEAYQACMQALGQELNRLQEEANGPDSTDTSD